MRREDVSWLVTGVDLQSLHADMPWLDTSIESGNVVYRYALAGYRNRIWKMQKVGRDSFPGWIHA